WKGAPPDVPDAFSPLSPLGDVGGLAPLDPLAEQKSTPRPGKKTKAGNNTTLIFILATTLGICVIPFILLAFWFLNSNSANAYQQAENEYESTALSSAIEHYDKYLQSKPTGTEASRARVRRKM